MSRSLLTVALAALMAACGQSTSVPDADGGAVDQLVDAQFDALLANDPEAMTVLGMDGPDARVAAGRLTDASLLRRAELRNALATNLAALDDIDDEAFAPQQQRTIGMARWFYRSQADLLAFDWSPAWLPLATNPYAVDQLSSIPMALPGFFASAQPVNGAAEARNYVARLHAVATKLDQVRDNLDLQAHHGVVPPRVALEGAALQIRDLMRVGVDGSPFLTTLARKLDTAQGIDAPLREELLRDARSAIEAATLPAYGRLLSRIEAAIAVQDADDGVWALPDGAAYYAAALRWNTGVGLDAAQLHALGHAEVRRIREEMAAIVRNRLTLPENAVIADDAAVTALAATPAAGHAEMPQATPEAVRAAVQARLETMAALLPRYFAASPTQPLEVQLVTAGDEAPAPVYYIPPGGDVRPGTLMLDAAQLRDLPDGGLPTLVYHNGLPGHHLQVGLSQAHLSLPRLRRSLAPTAFTEGWAMYAERLAVEMGVYDDDPQGDLGRLRAELLHAARLVVDTGLHSERWTLAQAQAYLRDVAGMTQAQARNEAQRQLVRPGRACAHTVGLHTLLALRAQARHALGRRFDLRAFHGVLLENGALPLDVVSGSVDAWIDAVRIEDEGGAG
ncbi:MULTISPECIES: DUF885 domain-containing protein [Luteimonas]|uniref:DUF885 domain-containing protein n=1 Tax=Luteimonas chenhongjianii TaxID=2006110 RepID=A0A290XFV0_9GAMM|nr:MULTISPECIES: DUF885 domain-containing protein [Luteimonas]ATD68010.1 hypothetical protein CNR27_11700 [Luteimonas chenhongjianii]RPD88327.1 DUF885 domain-containing protein [Luteimonas sp. 100069]